MNDDSQSKLVDPPRLLDAQGGDGELRRLLRAGADDLPNEARVAAIAAKLGPIVGGGGAGPGGGGGATKAAAKGAAKAGAGKAAAIWHASTMGAGVKALGVAAVVSGLLAGGAFTASRMRAPEAKVLPRVAETAAPVVETAPAPAAIAPMDTSSAAAEIAPTAAPKRAPPSSETSPEDEVKLLERAQDALGQSPSRALALCEEHRTRFAHPALAQEREVIAIEALKRAGRTGEARARADRFALTYPTSTHLRRVRAIVEGP